MGILKPWIVMTRVVAVATTALLSLAAFPKDGMRPAVPGPVYGASPSFLQHDAIADGAPGHETVVSPGLLDSELR